MNEQKSSDTDKSTLRKNFEKIIVRMTVTAPRIVWINGTFLRLRRNVITIVHEAKLVLPDADDRMIRKNLHGCFPHQHTLRVALELRIQCLSCARIILWIFMKCRHACHQQHDQADKADFSITHFQKDKHNHRAKESNPCPTRLCQEQHNNRKNAAPPAEHFPWQARKKMRGNQKKHRYRHQHETAKKRWRLAETDRAISPTEIQMEVNLERCP